MELFKTLAQLASRVIEERFVLNFHNSLKINNFHVFVRAFFLLLDFPYFFSRFVKFFFLDILPPVQFPKYENIPVFPDFLGEKMWKNWNYLR